MGGIAQRLQHIDDVSWWPLLIVAELGAIVVLMALVCMAAQLYVSIRTRDSRRVSGDPWNGRTLEWATSSPPPPYNFAVLPRVTTIDAFWEMKRRGVSSVEPTYEPIETPRNSPTGFLVAFFAVLAGFSLIWHIWWLAVISLLTILATAMVFGWSENRERRNSGHRGRANGAGPPRACAAGMTIGTTIEAVPTELARGRGGGGPAPTRTVVAYGSWIFIISDIAMFSALFAAYAVLAGRRPAARPRATLSISVTCRQTVFLLLSSYACGLGALSAELRQPSRYLIFAALTFVLGAAFLFIEISRTLST